MSQVYIISMHYIDCDHPKDGSFHRIIGVYNSRYAAKNILNMVESKFKWEYDPKYLAFKITERCIDTYKNKYDTDDNDTEYCDNICHRCREDIKNN